MRGEVLTPWTTVTDPESGEVSQLPLLWQVMPHGKMIDVTSQFAHTLIPDPNLTIVEWEAPPESFAAIAGDARFFVLWSEA